MFIGRKTIIATIAGAIFALSAGSAFAAPGQATGNVNVRTGPGTSYARVDTLHRGEAVDISQCRSGWCYVTHSGPDGWVSANYLSRNGGSNWGGSSGNNSDPDVGFSFGFGSNGAHFGFSFGNQQPQAPEPNWQQQNQPRACFFTGTHYSGRSICVTGNRTIAYVGDAWNDRVSSVRLYNGASVTMCQNNNYGGYCRTTHRNEAALGPYLNNRISSVRVY